MSAEKKMSRRDLLKLAGAGSAGLVMSGLPVTVDRAGYGDDQGTDGRSRMTTRCSRSPIFK